MSKIDWSNVYTDHATEYELLVSHEDHQDNLLAAIRELQPLEGRCAVEFGCGTGRVTGLLAGRVRELHAFDLTPSMLDVAREKQDRLGWPHVHLALADSREMPVRGGWADFAIQGWAFLHIAVWHPQDWQVQLGRALDEMQRLVRPGGRMILIETLGTGGKSPDPAPAFRQVYDWIEQERGFQPRAIRTDYRFETMEQVETVVLPLFGEEMRPRLEHTPQGILLPECTGLWWREA
jgi:ubiquinone/menaquinone biosynthesis C-methylase UbiE